MTNSSKEIKVLSEHEHILKRPTIYVGSVKLSDEQIPILRGGILRSESRQISVGMYKLFDEVLSNSLDEAKRMNGKMKEIKISVNTQNNSVSVEDFGEGFYKASEINKKSGMSNVSTAVSMLRAGSNFENDSVQETLIGTNGMGVSLVNALSSRFYIKTSNKKEIYSRVWNNFVGEKEKVEKRSTGNPTGTLVEFTPLDNVFDGCKWDPDIIKTTLFLKKRVLETEEKTKDLKIFLNFDGEETEIDSKFNYEESYSTKIGEICIWEKEENSSSFSFVNSAMCTGIHQKVVWDMINQHLEDPLAHHFYDFLLILNLPPALVKFGDQNKTRFVTKREEILPVVTSAFSSKINSFSKTPLFKRIKKKVDDRKKSTELKVVRREKRNVNVKYSHKYFPPSSKERKNLFIVEGLSAMGSLLQKRNTKTDGVYALKGKIKNVRSIADLSSNREILELMKILDLDPESTNSQITYQNIVIATDQDPDGAHIMSLLINLFYSWFPWVIKRGMLSFLETPLISVGERKKDYFYSISEFEKSSRKDNVRYLKGLGSLSLDDWGYVMQNKRMIKIKEESGAKKYLNMAFGKSAQLRKDWLSGTSYWS